MDTGNDLSRLISLLDSFSNNFQNLTFLISARIALILNFTSTIDSLFMPRLSGYENF